MSDQPDLFDPRRQRRRRPRPPSGQRENLNRVTSAIGAEVLAFVRSKGVGAEFRAKDLHAYVEATTAPASADRILRNLRQMGALDYVVVDRRASLYRVTSIEKAA